MGTVLRPVGPLPPRVYWVRRLLLIGAVVLVVALVAAVVSKVAGAGEPDGATGKPAAASTSGAGDGKKVTQEVKDAASGDADKGGTEEAPETPGDVPACAKGDVGIKLSADGETFKGRNVKFALEVTNTSDRSCLIDVTHKTRELVIMSGPARVWGSADCVAPEPRMLLLAAGQSDKAALTWKRVRSEPGCPTKGVEAKPGTYRATATVLGRASDEVVLVLS